MYWKQHILRIQSKYLYCFGDWSTIAEMHQKNRNFHSTNILYASNLKLWIFISPYSCNALEYNIQQHFNITAKCFQFTHHLHCLPSPSMLHQWNILFSIRQQYPENLILVLLDVYHYIINESTNLANAINYTEPN